MTIDHKVYLEKCRERWSGAQYSDARANWSHFNAMHDDLVASLREFKRNPLLTDLAGQHHNPDGTLTAFLWKLQGARSPNNGSLWPLCDFCDHYQRVFLRRGLIVYCTLILRAIEAAEADASPLPLFPATGTHRTQLFQPQETNADADEADFEKLDSIFPKAGTP